MTEEDLTRLRPGATRLRVFGLRPRDYGWLMQKSPLNLSRIRDAKHHPVHNRSANSRL